MHEVDPAAWQSQEHTTDMTAATAYEQHIEEFLANGTRGIINDVPRIIGDQGRGTLMNHLLRDVFQRRRDGRDWSKYRGIESATWVFTSICNLDCGHCSAGLRRKYDRVHGFRELDVDLMANAFAEWHGSDLVTFLAGGEPELCGVQDFENVTEPFAVSEGFRRIVDSAGKYHQKTYFITSGYNIDENDPWGIVHYLASFADGVGVCLSLDEWHEEELREFQRRHNLPFGELRRKVIALKEIVRMAELVKAGMDVHSAKLPDSCPFTFEMLSRDREELVRLAGTCGASNISKDKLFFSVTVPGIDTERELRSLAERLGFEEEAEAYMLARSRERPERYGRLAEMIVFEANALGYLVDSDRDDLDPKDPWLSDIVGRHLVAPFLFYIDRAGRVLNADHMSPLVEFPEEFVMGNLYEDSLTYITWNGTFQRMVASPLYRLTIFCEYLVKVSQALLDCGDEERADEFGEKSGVVWKKAHRLSELDPERFKSDFEQLARARAQENRDELYDILAQGAHPYQEIDQITMALKVAEVSFPGRFVADFKTKEEQARFVDGYLDKHPDRRDSSVETIARQLVRLMRNWSSDEAPYLLEVPYAGEGIPHFVVGRMIRGSFPRDWTTEYLDLQLELRKRPWPGEMPFDPEERLAEIISDLIFYLRGGEVRHIEG